MICTQHSHKPRYHHCTGNDLLDSSLLWPSLGMEQEREAGLDPFYKSSVSCLEMATDSPEESDLAIVLVQREIYNEI